MKILFVCLGNICRSPMAEGVLKHLAGQHQLDWHVESAGTEYYHIGEQPDNRAIRTCNKYGIDISRQRARRICKKDFEEFDVIYALADDILYELNAMKPKQTSGLQLRLLMDEVWPGMNQSVPDPWYGTLQDFDSAYKLIEEACTAIVMQHAMQ